MESADLPDSVTSIGNRAFYNCTSLIDFRYPASWTTAGTNYWNDEGIFEGCKKLETITIPEGITSIPANAFTNANYLTHIEIPDSLRIIGSYAFSKCTNIQEIDLPVDLTTVKERAFSGCTALENIYLSPAVVTIGTKVFENCPNVTVYCEDQTVALMYCQNNNINYAIR